MVNNRSFWLGLMMGLGGFWGPAALVQADQEQRGGASKQSVAFITFRDKTGNFSDPEHYFGERRSVPRQGYCQINWYGSEILQRFKANASFYIPAGNADIAAITEMPVAVFRQSLQQRLRGQKPLLYVHGYNVSFGKACLRSRLLQENLGMQKQLVLLSWPSDGNALNYARDEADIEWSEGYIEQVLLDFRQQYGPAGFDLMAHSLGTRGVIRALIRLARDRQGQPLLNNLVLIAGDVDAAVVAWRIRQLRSVARRITVYASDQDQPLMISHELHGYPRLGQMGPHLDALQGAEVIDVSGLSVERFSGHLYHLSNRYVIRDLKQLLVQQKGAHERQAMRRSPGRLSHYWSLLAD